MSQLDLFAPRPPAQEHSATSVAAALSVEPRAGTLRRKVLDLIRERGALGATDDEVQIALDMNGSTQRPRRVELERGGLIVKTAQKRKTRGGEEAFVYMASEHFALAGNEKVW